MVMQQAIKTFFFLFLPMCPLFANTNGEILSLVPGSSNNKEFACLVKGLVEEKMIPNANFRIEDSQNDPIITGGLVERAAKTGVKIIIGTLSSQEALAAVSKLGNEQVLIVPLASHPKVTASGKHVISMVSSSVRYTKLFASYIAKSHTKGEAVFIVKNVSQPYSVFYAEEMERLLSVSKFKVSQFAVNDGFENFDALIEKIALGNFPIVYMPLYTSQAAKIYSLLAAKKWRGTIYSQGAINDGREFFEVLNGPPIVFNSIWDEKFRGPNKDLFVKIRDKYCKGTAQSVRQIFAFDAFMLLKRYLQRDGVFNFDGALKGTFEGLAGTVKFDSNGNAVRDLFLYKTSDGKTRFLAKVSE